MKYTRNILILLFPFVLLCFVNESVRLATKEKSFPKNRNTINSNLILKNQCTWYCHQNTMHCKENHVKFLRPYFDYTDPLYFGLINGFNGLGNCQLMNIIFLVILLPILIYLLLIRILNLRNEIKQIKNS